MVLIADVIEDDLAHGQVGNRQVVSPCNIFLSVLPKAIVKKLAVAVNSILKVVKFTQNMVVLLGGLCIFSELADHFEPKLNELVYGYHGDGICRIHAVLRTHVT